VRIIRGLTERRFSDVREPIVVCEQRLPTMTRTAVSRSFSLRPQEAPRFDRMVERLASGSPTEFIRKAMDRMEAVEWSTRWWAEPDPER
jgi:hypothetical protein